MKCRHRSTNSCTSLTPRRHCAKRPLRGVDGHARVAAANSGAAALAAALAAAFVEPTCGARHRCRCCAGSASRQSNQTGSPPSSSAGWSRPTSRKQHVTKNVKPTAQNTGMDTMTSNVESIPITTCMKLSGSQSTNRRPASQVKIKNKKNVTMTAMSACPRAMPSNGAIHKSAAAPMDQPKKVDASTRSQAFQFVYESAVESAVMHTMATQMIPTTWKCRSAGRNSPPMPQTTPASTVTRPRSA
mmetsp:Transcript_22117/g.66081  ORF Transcript_22117/g.66081 Transcript_22117/m.66081 type:complete len:244 (-) Transcript_22117:366-1097(-)